MASQARKNFAAVRFRPLEKLGGTLEGRHHFGPRGLCTRSDEEIIHGTFVLEAEPIIINEVGAKGTAYRVAPDGSRRNVNLEALPVSHFLIRYRRQELITVLKPFAHAAK